MCCFLYNSRRGTRYGEGPNGIGEGIAVILSGFVPPYLKYIQRLILHSFALLHTKVVPLVIALISQCHLPFLNTSDVNSLDLETYYVIIIPITDLELSR